MVAHPRTGSTYLSSLLDGRPDVRYHGELWPNWTQFQGNFLAEMVLDRREVPRVFGKVFYKYLNHVFDGESGFWTRWELLEYLARKSVPVIHIQRKNILDTAISYLLASTEKTYVGVNYKEPISVDPRWLGQIMSYILWSSRIVQDALDMQKVRTIQVWYDDVVTRPQEVHDRIADFVHLPRVHSVAQPKYIKQRIWKQSESLVNYWELKERFSGSPFAEYFED